VPEDVFLKPFGSIAQAECAQAAIKNVATVSWRKSAKFVMQEVSVDKAERPDGVVA
jgi:hypothetical protein